MPPGVVAIREPKENNNPVKAHEFVILLKIGKSYEYIEVTASINFQ